MKSPKDVVTSLMQFEGREKRTVTEKGKQVQRDFLRYRCPKLSFLQRIIQLKEKQGFQNPYAHLRSCYGRGKPMDIQKVLLDDMNDEAKKAADARGGSIANNFNLSALSEYERAMNHYIRQIVTKRYPLSSVVDSDYRAMSRFSCAIDAKTIRAVKLSLVEDRVKEDLTGKKGTRLFDGWTCYETHYVAMILSYCDIVSTIVEGEPKKKNVTRLELLAASPMENLDDECAEDGIDDSTEETATFNAVTHLAFFRDNFRFFGQEFDDWCICVISDNCNTNRRIASDCTKPMVRCYSEKWNLEVNKMIRNVPDLSNVVQSVHKTMKAAKGRLKNTAMLRNLTRLSPVIPNDTRWSGKCHMVNRFVRIRTELISVSNEESCELPMESSVQFVQKAKRYGLMLGEINAVTKSLQTRCRSLKDCRGYLEDLRSAIDKSAEDASLPLHGCALREHYVGEKSRLVSDPAFESGVLNLQSGDIDVLTECEKTAINGLKLDSTETSGDGKSSNNTVLSMRERLAKRQKVMSTPRSYMPCNFIIGSVAEVERVWSIAKHFLHRDIRNCLTPVVLQITTYANTPFSRPL